MTRLRRLVAPAFTRCARPAGDEGSSRRAPEDGFTLVELMVATSIMTIAIVAMLYTTMAGLRGIAVARQRQTATALANQSLEQLRALPFDTVKRGLDNTDLTNTTDTSISKAAPIYRYGGEQIPHGDNASATPLVPHQQTIVRNNITYTVSAYVTYFQDNLTSNTYRATAVVSWARRVGGGTSQVQAQTIMYSPAGCESTATHPFSAPCQAFLYGSASNSSGSVSVRGSIQSLTLDHATLWLPGQSSGMQVEQVQAVQGTAQTSGVSLQLSGQDEQTAGRQSASTGADDDRSQTKPDYQTASTLTQTAGTFTSTASNNSISVSDDAGDTAATTSTVTANNSSHICPLLVPTSSFDSPQNDSAPCGSSKAQQGGTLATSMTVKAGPTSLTSTLFSLGAPTAPSGAFTNRETSTTTDGSLKSLQYRSRGTATLVTLPSALPGGDIPAGYNSAKGLVQLTNFSDSVSAEAGIGTAAPSVSVAGTINYYNGSGYSTITLAAGAPVSIPLGSGGNGVHIVDNSLNGAPLAIDVTANLTTGGTATTDSGAVTCTMGICRASASATSNSPISGTVTYQVTYAGSLVTDLTVTVDLGTLLAKSSYTAAPSGA